MSLESWSAYAFACVIVLVIPGPTILTVISYSLSHGARAKIPLVLAVAMGDSTALVLSLLGLGTLLAKSAFLFQVVKWVGGGYLIYLGIKLLRAGVAPSDLNLIKQKDSGWKLFVNTWLVTALNPKGIIFFIAFLPQFLTAGADVAGQMWILSLTFVFLAALNASLFAIFAGQARRMLATPRAQRLFNIGGGALLSFAGLWALTARRA